MTKLAARQKSAISSGTIPVIADANAMQRLNLKIGTTFALQVSNLDFSSLNFVVVAQVQHIPTINDNTVAGSTGNYVPPAGILVDYKTYSTVYNAEIVVANGLKSDAFLPLNHIWLRTKDDAGSLSQVRAALNTPGLHLENLNDRYTLNNTLSNDPLYLDLIIILIIGAITTLLLAVIGDLLTSWLNVRTRLTSFAVLRALGASPRQIASVLTWEQAIVYVAALILGVVFGALLSLTVVPTLIFTGAPASLTDINEFYTLQHIIPAQIVIPLSLDIVFIVLVIVCITALGMMTRVVLSPSMSQTLRLNED
jgi:ABC-type antimicrobial peptide transport system permease subunit